MIAGAFARVITRGAERPRASTDRCAVCAGALPDAHRHGLDLERDEVLCLCKDCVVLFGHEGAGGERFRLIPQRRVRLFDFDPRALGLPVGLAALVLDDHGVLRARNPSVAGVTEWEVERDDWKSATESYPALATLQPRVEAVLVNSLRGRACHWLVPIDDSYRLAGTVRSSWRGLSGGDEIWLAIDAFFEDLGRRDREAR